MHNPIWSTTVFLLGTCLSAGVAHAQEAAAVVITEPVNLAAACGAKSSGEGVHGGTQTRICWTSHGSYTAFMGEDEGGKVVIYLIRIRNSRSERLASLPTKLSGSNSVQVVCDADQEVYVVAPGTEYTDGKERAVLTAYHVDRDTGATTEHRATVPFGRGHSFGYGVAFLDTSCRSAYALYSGGDALGYLAWVRFDLAEKRWAEKAVVAELAYRHCYSYGFADGPGGAVILSERDVLIKTVGVARTDLGRDPGTNYVWDELLTEKRLGDEVKPSYGLVISCQRSGSIRDDVVDALFPVGHAYHHFQILDHCGLLRPSAPRPPPADRAGDAPQADFDSPGDLTYVDIDTFLATF